MGIDHRCLDAFMSQQLLDGSQIGAVLQQMGRVGVAECMRGDFFVDLRFLRRFFDVSAQCGFQDVVASCGSAARVS